MVFREIKLWSRNKSWARGAVKFILANKIWACACGRRLRVDKRTCVPRAGLTSRRVMRVDKWSSKWMKHGEDIADEEKG